MAVGIVGVGQMGHGIAACILQAGHRLSFMVHPGNQPTDDLLALGACALESPAAVAERSEVVVLCVNGSAQVEEVVHGMPDRAGLLAGLRPESIVVDCSTSLPNSTRQLARAIAARGAHMLDAAMTRTPREAALGKLNLLVGGDAQVLMRCMPLLQCFSETLTHAGPIGCGHQMKLIHNFASIGSVVLLAEAAASSRHAGIDDAVLVKILSEGGAWGAALDRLRPYLLHADISALRFSLDNALKDLRYYCAMVQETPASGAPPNAHALGEAVRITLEAACAGGDASRALPTIVDWMAPERT